MGSVTQSALHKFPLQMFHESISREYRGDNLYGLWSEIINSPPGRCNPQVARLRLTGYPLGFHRLVTVNQGPLMRVIKPHQDVRPENVLCIEIKSYLYTQDLRILC